MTDRARVCAVLSWFDESPLWLSACVASLAGVADHIVACDGAYQLFPGRSAASPVAQQQAIVETARAARISLTLHVPSECWAGEVEKRNATLDLARVAASDPSWWLLIVDADMVVTHASGGLATALGRTDLDVAEFGVTHREDPQANPAVANAARTGLWQKESLQPYRMLYRAAPSLRYEGAHYVVRSDRGYLWGHQRFHDLLPAEDVTLELVCDHRSKWRELERKQRAQSYYRVRDSLAVETLQPVEVAA